MAGLAGDAWAYTDRREPVPGIGYDPDSGMVYRQLDDGLWYVLDVVATEGFPAGPFGLVPLTPSGPRAAELAGEG